MLDEEDGVACLDHRLKKVKDAADVVEVEAVGRLVHNEDFARVAEVGRQLDALQLAARKRRKRLVQMEIAQPDLAQWLQFFGNDSACKHFRGFVGSHIHHFGDVLSLHLIKQDLVGVTQPAASLTNGFDAVHKSHITDNHALALTNGATSLAVEGEQIGLGLVGFGKQLADVVGHFEVGGWRGA